MDGVVDLVGAMTLDDLTSWHMRAELLDHLEQLAKHEPTDLNVRAEWFGYTGDFFLNDTPLWSAPDDAIGLFLLDGVETAAAHRVAYVLHTIFQNVHLHASSTPARIELVAAARAALDCIAKGLSAKELWDLAEEQGTYR